MLNNEKITLMTKIALYEQKNEDSEIKTSRFFKSDYISLKMLGSFACVTLGFILIVALYLIYSSSKLVSNMSSTTTFVVLVVTFIILYIIIAIGYMIFSYRFYTKKFKDIRKNLKEYNGDLKTLHRIQDLEYDAIIKDISEEGEKENA